MKYCQYCGGEIHDDAVVCIHCGRSIQNTPACNKNSSDTLVTIAKVFMVLSCVAAPAVGLIYGSILLIVAAAVETSVMVITAIIVMIFCCLPLAWTLPLTLTVSKRQKDNEPIGMGIKICTLLFVNMIAGVLLLCHNDDN